MARRELLRRRPEEARRARLRPDACDEDEDEDEDDGEAKGPGEEEGPGERLILKRALLAFLPSVAFVACDAPYEAPCRVVGREDVVTDDAIGARPSVALSRRDGGFSASWPRIDRPDASPDPTPTVAGFDVVDLDADGAVVRRETIAAPAELRARKGSIEDVGVAREDGATLVYWTESTTTTDPDGRVRTAFALKGAYGEQVIAPRAAACAQCTMKVGVVAFGDESIAIVRTAPDVVLAPPGTPPVSATFVAIHFRRANDATSAEPLPWLAAPSKAPIRGLAAAAPASLEVARDGEGRIVVASDGRSWVADRSLRPIADAVDLPTSDARALFGPRGDATVAWAISATEEGRSTQPFTKREVFVAHGTEPRERISYGRGIVAADRRDDDVGLVFESAGRLFFAASSASGKKRGGDVLVRIVETRASEYGAFSSEDAMVLGGARAGAFTLVTLGRGVLSTTEIVCAP